MLVYWMLIP